jgi:enoyl-CoA hydratase/carnithine racemase
MTRTGRLHEERSGGTVWLTLDNPPANALTNALIGDLASRLACLAGDPAARAVVLTGSGERFFCAGGDIRELEVMTVEKGVERVRTWYRVLEALEGLPVPVVCAANGDAVGGGTELCLFADYRVAVEGARFGLPEINHGLIPADKSMHRAVEVVGLRQARRLLYGGSLVSTREAAEIGLVDDVVAGPAEMRERVSAWAEEMGRKHRRLFRAIKAALNGGAHPTDAEARSVENFRGYFEDPAVQADLARALRRGKGEPGDPAKGGARGAV